MADDDLTPVELFDEAGAEPPVSAKALRRKQRKAEKAAKQARRNPKPLEPRTATQADYIDSLRVNELTFATGPAGVGKTYVPSRLFGEQLAAGEIEKLYVARPNISKPKHRNGFLPGSLEEKTAPWLVPIFEGVRDAMGGAEFDRLKREKKIEEVPFEFMQGRTFKNAACIIDEAENLDEDDFYITLTRQGEDLSMVFCGDIYQARIPDSGFAKVVEMAKRWNMEGVGIIDFTVDDIVRSRQAKQWAKAFRAHWGQGNLHDVTECGMDESKTFRDNLPEFLKGAA